MRRPSAALLGLSLAFCLALPRAEAKAPSEAARKKKAVRLLEKGNKAYERAKYQDALRAYEEAYQTFPSPKLFFSIGRTQVKLGDSLRGAETLERFLVEAGEEPESPLTKAAMDALDEVSKVLGRLSLSCNVEGASITLDGQALAAIPAKPIWTNAGLHRVTAESSGYEPFEAQIDAPAGVVTPVSIQLTVKAPPAELVTTPPPMSTPPPEGEEEGGVASKWWFWAAIAVAGAAAVGVGVAVAGGGEAFVPPEGELGATRISDWQRL